MNGERDILNELEGVVQSRKATMPEDSYTTELLKKGMPRISGKIIEESLEVIQALNSEEARKVNSEIADLLYHLTVGMVETGKGSWQEVLAELEKRRDKSK